MSGFLQLSFPFPHRASHRVEFATCSLSPPTLLMPGRKDISSRVGSPIRILNHRILHLPPFAASSTTAVGPHSSFCEATALYGELQRHRFLGGFPHSETPGKGKAGRVQGPSTPRAPQFDQWVRVGLDKAKASIPVWCPLGDIQNWLFRTQSGDLWPNRNSHMCFCLPRSHINRPKEGCPQHMF